MPLETIATCDRCGDQVIGTYYSLRVYAEDTKGGLTLEAASQNVRTNLAKDKTYCPRCMEQFRKEFKF